MLLGAVVAIRSPDVVGGIAIACGSALLGLLTMLAGVRSSIQTEEIVVDLVKADIVQLPLLTEVAARRATQKSVPSVQRRRRWI